MNEELVKELQVLNLINIISNKGVVFSRDELGIIQEYLKEYALNLVNANQKTLKK